jgi:hypothetical protein
MEIIKIIAGALGFTYENRGVFFKKLALPVAILVFMDVLLTLKLPYLVITFISLVGMLIHIIMAVTVHRVTLIGENSVPDLVIKKWSNRETSFLLKSFGIGLIIIPFATLGLLINAIAGYIFLVAGCILISRVSLVFPSIAIDDNISFQESWNYTKPYKLLMVVSVVFFPTLLAIPNFILSYVPFSTPVISVIYSLTTVLTITALSLTYQHIKSNYQARS